MIPVHFHVISGLLDTYRLVRVEISFSEVNTSVPCRAVPLHASHVTLLHQRRRRRIEVESGQVAHFYINEKLVVVVVVAAPA